MTAGGTIWYPKAVCLKISCNKGKWPKKPNSDKLLQFDSVNDSSGIYDSNGLDSLKILVVEKSVTFTSHFPVVTGIAKNWFTFSEYVIDPGGSRFGLFDE